MMVIKAIYELDKTISELEDTGDYFVDFLRTPTLEAGILRLHPGEIDSQKTHSKDELYHVIRGDGGIRIGEKDHTVRSGTSIFVPAGVEHHFHGNRTDLTVLYVFPT